MLTDYSIFAENFLSKMIQEEQTKLYNDLLALDTVYKTNCNRTFYTFKHLTQARSRYSEKKKRTFRYTDSLDNELVIQQIHEKHFFKNTYSCHIYLNSKEQDYALIEVLIQQLKLTLDKDVLLTV